MDKLTEKLKDEMNSWVGDIVTNSDLPNNEFLKRYAYEYCIKEEIINYFSENATGNEFYEFLLDKEDTLGFLYEEYMDDDMANIHDTIEGFINDVYYNFVLL